MIRSISLLLPLALLAGPAAAETLYIQSATTKLLAAPQFGAEVVGELKRGSAVEQLGTDGRWLHVSGENMEGWLTRFVVAETPPLDNQGLLTTSEEITPNARRRASAVTTAGAARGLASDERVRMGADERTNYLDLLRMEQLTVSEGEVMEFEQGVVGQ